MISFCIAKRLDQATRPKSHRQKATETAMQNVANRNNGKICARLLTSIVPFSKIDANGKFVLSTE